ncbi:MAG: hypothetical protein GY750_02230 [Lentisphaerae bacterium]|nr:hypothetical protein [Lentisphaerota bacterium]MCP4100238.1 hypothetical protein [Lentisphaerota bacterium]
MNPLHRKILKNKIISEIEDLEDTIEELKHVTQPIAPDRAIGRISRMDAIGNRSINNSVLNNAKERLVKLQYALDKADGPEFGICTSCGNVISPNRLLEVPEATHCISCSK